MMPMDGLHLLSPASIAYTGTSASISTYGSVTFSAVTTLSLNSVFSSNYDNYQIVIRSVHSAAQQSLNARLRSAGIDEIGANYSYQYLNSTGTSVSGARTTSSTLFVFGETSQTQRSGDTTFVFGPYLTQPTAVRTINANGNSNGDLYDFGSVHSLSASYDGFTLSVSSGNFSGRISVYGMVK